MKIEGMLVMDQYSNFAYVYDRLMEDVDYDGWVDYIEGLLKLENHKPKRILELACGTGNITIPLSKRGYEIMGVDISQDMLSVADDKASEAGERIIFLEQDMRELEVEDGGYDCVLCLCDGINYVTEVEDLHKVFHLVYESLSQEGLFIFDVSSYYKLKNILGENTFGENLGDLCYLWENYFNEDTDTIEMDLTLFIQEGRLFKKMEEYHLQRAYRVEELTAALKKAGFNNITSYNAFEYKEPKEESERIFFLVKK